MATARMTISSSSCEKLLKPAPIGVPPGAVEGIGHHFEDDDIVLDDLALGFAGAMGRCARESSDAPEAARQVLPDLPILPGIEALPFVVGNRQKDINEVVNHPQERGLGSPGSDMTSAFSPFTGAASLQVISFAAGRLP